MKNKNNPAINYQPSTFIPFSVVEDILICNYQSHEDVRSFGRKNVSIPVVEKFFLESIFRNIVRSIDRTGIVFEKGQSLKM
jgi:hypothetical protein